METPQSQFALISDCSRIVVGLAGLALLISSAFIFYCPPTRTLRETTGTSTSPDVSTKETTTDADPSAVASFALISGAALLAFGINGVKMTKFSSSVLNAEAVPFTPAAQQPPNSVQPSLPNTQIDAVIVIRGYLNSSSWNGIKVIYSAMRAQIGVPFNFRDLCSRDSRMSHDYAFAYLVASSSLGLFTHTSDPGGQMISVTAFLPIVREELMTEIERRLRTEAADAPLKRAEMARIDAFFGVV